MIPLILCFFQQNSTPQITEYPTLDRQSVAIEAIVKLPKMNPAQRYILTQAMNLSVQMTAQYANQDILRILQTGTRFRLYQAADHLRVGLTVDSADVNSGLNLLYSVLTEPSFLPDTIKARKSTVTLPWSVAYRGFDSQESPLDQRMLAEIWQGIMRPSNISVAVSGHFRAGEPSERWRSKQSGWIFNVPNQLPLAYPPIAKEAPNSPPILVFDSKPLTMTPSSLASYLLASNALGVGKESIQWLVAREGLNMSYRQEAFLIPTAEGWRFRMAFATDDLGVKSEAIADLRTKLRARCEALTQADLDHAIGLAEGYLSNQMPTLPMLLGIGEVLSNDANDQLYLQQYWKAMHGFEWKPELILMNMRAFSVLSLKKVLLQLIDELDVRIY